MPTYELTEEQVRAAAASQELLKTIAGNPKARALLQQAYKAAKPDAVIPEIDAQSELSSQLSEIRKTVDDFVSGQTAAQKAQAEAAEKAQVETRYNEGMARLRQQGVTEEGIKEVEKLMASEGILNPEIAWNHFEKLHPQPQPVLPSGVGGGFNFTQTGPDANENIKKLIESRGENVQVLDQMARDALNEVRGTTPRR